MKAKIICIIVMTLLITTALPTIGVTINKIGNENPPPLQNGAVDQEQTIDCNYGMVISPPELNAQSFKPTRENLTLVQLKLFKHGTPPANVEITVTIRNDLNGTDLTSKTINADKAGIKASGTWVYFDFNDITVIPEETYYIVCYANDGELEGNCYCWLFGLNDTYTRGEAWYYNNTAGKWMTLWEATGFDPEWIEPDLCFKTYFKNSKEKTIDRPFLNFLQSFFEDHPNMFPLIQKLIQQLGFDL